MDQSEQTRTVVMDLLQRVAAGDPAKIAKLYAENVTWKLGWPEKEIGGSVPWIRRRSRAPTSRTITALLASFTFPVRRPPRSRPSSWTGRTPR